MISCVIGGATKKLLEMSAARATPASQDPRQMRGLVYASLLWYDRRKSWLSHHAATCSRVSMAERADAADCAQPTRLVTGLVEREIRTRGSAPATFGKLRLRRS